jgi:tripartite-type tricarboxylate transporter receptor subunit TctC
MHRILTRRALLALLGASAAAPFARAEATGAFRPTRPVRILSPQQPGGSTDAVLRPLAQKLAEMWGQPVLVDNRPGGGSLIATQAVVQAAPDGHTLGLAINALTINPSLRQDLPYDTLRDITPLTQIGNATIAFVAHPSLGVATLPEFVALARAKPGTLSWASARAATSRASCCASAPASRRCTCRSTAAAGPTANFSRAGCMPPSSCSNPPCRTCRPAA